VDADFADFPFLELLGLSSYPYFAWPAPEDLPDDYYSRLLIGRSVPVAVVEGGWTSEGFGSIVSSPARQRAYLERHARMLDGIGATAWFQLTFTDLALSAFPPPLAASLQPFARLGVVDTALAAKPALWSWDAHFARPLDPVVVAAPPGGARGTWARLQSP
jgi:hypothetical protein